MGHVSNRDRQVTNDMKNVDIITHQGYENWNNNEAPPYTLLDGFNKMEYKG